MAWAAVLGIVLGIGLWLIVLSTPRVGAAPLHERIAPYVADISEQAFRDVTRRSHNPLPWLGGASSTASRMVSRLSNLIPQPSAADELSLRQAASTLSADEFRARRTIWLLAGGVGGAVITGLLAQVTAVSLLGALLLPLVGALAGYMLCNNNLQRQARRRVSQLTEQVPAIWEFLALSVSAGESLPDALHRVARIGHGALVDEITAVVAQADLGVPIGYALQRMATELHVPSLSRGVDQLIGSLDRGTPIVAVLRDQAQDAREDSKRRLLESAGKKEVAMLVPLVFLILPVTIVFAVYPGLVVIQAGF